MGVRGEGGKSEGGGEEKREGEERERGGENVAKRFMKSQFIVQCW